MIGRTNGGVGTGALLIKVVGGLTRPENPTYGTVWLETEVPINGWQIFSVSPTWEAPEGHVYLQDAPSTSGGIPNFSMIDSGKKPYGCIWERLIGAFQRINGAWVWLNGAMWRDGVWTPFFAATINVTYPAGSICTATDGVTTLSAPDTSGTWACVVPNAGTWTVSITNNAGTKSKSVSITSSGQSEICVLGAPSDYQEVVYLQSTGTQCIDTKLTGKTYRFRVSTKVNIAESGGRLYGDNARPYNMLLWPVTDGIYPMTTHEGGPLGDKLPLGTTHTIDRTCSSSGVVTVKNGSNVIVTYDAKTYGFDNTKNYSPYIFCYNDEGTFKSFCKAKLYWMTIYDIDGTTPLREFVPCYRKSDSVAGLYDLVNDVFYTNAGTGTFVVGGDV